MSFPAEHRTCHPPSGPPPRPRTYRRISIAAETIARVVAERVAARLAGHPSEADVATVELWETPLYKVTYRP